MKRIHRIVSLVGAAAVVAVAGACDPDLNITNPNAPDRARAIATPGDVRNLIGTSYNGWYQGMQSSCCAGGSAEPDPGLMTAVMADNMTMAYGNFGARFNGQEPRLAYNNSSSAGDGLVGSLPYDNMYAALGSANDGLRAIKGGLKVAVSKSSPDETPQMQAFAYLVQGLTLGFVSLVFDRGFVIDEDTERDPLRNNIAVADLQSYKIVSAAAVTKLEKAIAAAAGKTWTVSTEFTPGITLTAANLARFANTMAARQLAYTPRTPEENAAVNWPKVLAFADKGISSGTPFDLVATGDGGVKWYDELKGYAELQSWVRVDQRVVQLMDPTQPVVFTSTVAPPKAVSKDARLETDFTFFVDIPYDQARGVYFFSNWGHTRYVDYGYESEAPQFGDAAFVLAAENDLLIAEPLIRTGGDRGRAASLINKTRVGRGKLQPLTAASSTNDLLAAIFYERDIELFATGAAQPWFDRRRIDRLLTYEGIPIGAGLQKGTPRHLPLPAKESETLGIPVTQYGGAAPNPVFPEM